MVSTWRFFIYPVLNVLLFVELSGVWLMTEWDPARAQLYCNNFVALLRPSAFSYGRHLVDIIVLRVHASEITLPITY